MKLVGLLLLISSLTLKAESRTSCETAIQKCNNALLATEAELNLMKQALKQQQDQLRDAAAERSALPWWAWTLIGAAGAITIQGLRK